MEIVSVKHLSLICHTSTLTTIYSLKNGSVHGKNFDKFFKTLNMLFTGKGSVHIHPRRPRGCESISSQGGRADLKSTHSPWVSEDGPYSEKLWPRSWKCWKNEICRFCEVYWEYRAAGHLEFWKPWAAVELKKVLSVTKHGFVFWAQRKPNTRLEIHKAF